MSRRKNVNGRHGDQLKAGSFAASMAAATRLALPRVPISSMMTAAWAVVKRPALWGEGLRLLNRSAAPGWWRTWPPIPAPPSEYLRFRLQTNSGGDGSNPEVRPHDLVDFLHWCRSNRKFLG